MHLQYLKLLFPRRGEQCPVVEFSYMGYSSPKFSCNCNQTNIQVNHAYPYLNVYMPNPMPRVLTDSLTHACAMYENHFQNKDICFICGQPSDINSGHTPINNYVDNPPIYYSGHTSINNCWSTLRDVFLEKPCHALTPNILRCPRAYEMQYVNSC